MGPSEPNAAAAIDEPRPVWTYDELARPFITVTGIVVTAVEIPGARLVAPVLAVVLFAIVSAFAIAALFPWTWLSSWQQVGLMGGYAIASAVLFPLVHTMTVAAGFAFLATATAGGKLASRAAALGIAGACAFVTTAATWVVGLAAPGSGQWSWWLTLSVGLPVYVGIARRDRMDALRSARRAAAETQRAAASEAREAALVERDRIAREIHDVLGHSLSAIALQLDMADALHESGRDDEASVAVRKARTLAVQSIAETRDAVHALREDTPPLPEALRLLADGDAAAFRVVGEPRPVSVEAAHTIVRAAQEALTNATKYAPGTAREMILTYTEERVSLTVTNGPGSTEAPAGIAGGTGTGLVGMSERVALLNGTMRAGPDPEDGGWTVYLEVPR
jgi:signal transduction histidine kinase